MRRLRACLTLLAVTATILGAAAQARATDPGRWLLTGASSVPVTYWQGLTTDPGDRNVFFVGIFEGLWRTDPLLGQSAGVANAIPASVAATEGYNHIGDPTWNPGEGGRVILPMECFTPGGPSGGNTCGTGAFGVADPVTLAFRYYVKLDPAEIPKAMWAETSPDGSLIWTSSGNDLLAYRTSDVTVANAGGGPVIHAVRRLTGAVPPTGVTGAVFLHGRLLLAGESGGTYQVWSVDTSDGSRRLEIEMQVCGESEGLDLIPTLGGELHWLFALADPRGCQPTFGPGNGLVHFIPRPAHERFDVTVLNVSAPAIPGTVTATVRAVRANGKPLRSARVSFAGGTARTSKQGVATVSASLKRRGRFAALARQGQNYGISSLAPVGIAATP